MPSLAKTVYYTDTDTHQRNTDFTISRGMAAAENSAPFIEPFSLQNLIILPVISIDMLYIESVAHLTINRTVFMEFIAFG